MGKFGILKEKILIHLTESYTNKNKDSIKTVLNKIKDKNFKELYLFYENFETKEISDESIIDQYITESEKQLKEKIVQIKDLQEELESLLKDVEVVNENSVYSLLDSLTENTNLNNLEEKIETKTKIKKHLLSTKEKLNENSPNFINNENLLLTKLTHDFNNKYSDFLSEDEKKTFCDIVNMNETELNDNFNTLVETTVEKLNTLKTGEPDIDVKIEETKEKILNENFKPNKVNYLTILDLNNSL